MKIGLTASSLNLFAKEIGASITRNETKGMWLPDKFESRSLNWRNGDFEYSIHIFPKFQNDQIGKWALSAWCVYERDQNRYSAGETFLETRKISQIVATIDNLLQESLSFLLALKFEDLTLN